MAQVGQKLSEAPKGRFMNQGKSGNWMKHLTPDQVKRFEAWEAEKLSGSDLKLNYGV